MLNAILGWDTSHVYHCKESTHANHVLPKYVSIISRRFGDGDDHYHHDNHDVRWGYCWWKTSMHQLIDTLSHYFQCFITRWCGISSINSIYCVDVHNTSASERPTRFDRCARERRRGRTKHQRHRWEECFGSVVVINSLTRCEFDGGVFGTSLINELIRTVWKYCFSMF